MNFERIFRPDLVDLNLKIADEDELFDYVADKLGKKNFVNPHYATALKRREVSFPTGLETEKFNITIPHADPENVKLPFIYIVRLANPITMRQMGEGGEIEVKEFFILGIKDANKQVGVLSSLMDLFTNNNFAEEYLAASTAESVYSAVTKYL